MSKLVLFIIVCYTFLGGYSLSAQTLCASQTLQNQSDMQTIDEYIHTQLQAYHANYPSVLQQKCTNCLTIPVVVHIIHENGPENISDDQVYNAIEWLNESFANQGYYYSENGYETEINFCLAQQDTLGQPTNGITRDEHPLTNLVTETQDVEMKNINRWDPTKYLNIWVVASITSQSQGAGVAGYAYFPSSHGGDEDGIVVESGFMGGNAQNNSVLSHEAGHYLGLYHTFTGGCVNNDCTTDGDKVCDTPPDQSTEAIPCGSTTNTCNSDEDDNSPNNPFRPIASGGLGDQNDMHTNFMDYGNQACLISFTEGQSDRMTLSLTGPRNSLLNSEGCQTPCAIIPVASFTASAEEIEIGGSIDFTNTSTGGTLFDWYIDGVLVGSTENWSEVFTTSGNYTITLEIGNDQEGCTDDYEIEIDVQCDSQGEIIAPITPIDVGDNINFMSSSSNVISYEWLVDGVSLGSASTFNYQFDEQGGYLIQLITCSSQCCDTASYYAVVGTCIDLTQSHWRFGNGVGLDFSLGGEPVAVGGSPLFSDEGCAAISDELGNILFFSNGQDVWDATNALMPNGTGLLGNQSTAQGVVIIPNPANSDRYYLFANDQLYNSPLSYSEVDMTLNGGLGDIVATTKNTILFNETGEQMVAVQHCNGTDYWLISFDMEEEKMVSVLIDANGIGAPVYSDVSYNGWGGYLVASPNGKKLAKGRGVISTFTDGIRYMGLYDFDNSTGLISNFQEYQLPPTSDVYGACFSPDNSKLYCSGPILNGLAQLDLSSNDPIQIQASATLVTTQSISPLKGMQLGPDGKIYIARLFHDQLARINNPNAAGVACMYESDAVTLPGTSLFGLPSQIHPKINRLSTAIVGKPNVCLPDSTVIYHIEADCQLVENVTWTHSGPNEIVSIDETTFDVTMNFDELGSDTLYAEVNTSCGTLKDTLIITSSHPVEFDLGDDLVLCVGDSVELDFFGNDYVIWTDEIHDSSVVINEAGTYWVEIYNDGCLATDTIHVEMASINQFQLPQDTSLCDGDVLVIESVPPVNSLVWQDGFLGESYTVFESGIYWASVETTCGVISDTIVVQALSSTSLISDTFYCESGTGTVSVSDEYASYSWSDGSTESSTTIETDGTYSVDVMTLDGCSISDTFEVLSCGSACDEPFPNVITPNDDGVNDVLWMQCLDELSGSITLFNRWGNQIFYADDYQNDWDGGNHPDGVYYYKIWIEVEQKEITGFFHLVR